MGIEEEGQFDPKDVKVGKPAKPLGADKQKKRDGRIASTGIRTPFSDMTTPGDIMPGDAQKIADGLEAEATAKGVEIDQTKK